MTSVPERFKTNGKLFAVVDKAEAVPGVRAALADVGVPDDAVEVLQGEEDAARAFGGQRGLWGRIGRAISFTIADQWVDFAVYAAALHDGRVVLAVRPPRGADRRAAVEVLKRGGAHFLNYYGAMMTEDISPWRGEHLDIPWGYHR